MTLRPLLANGLVVVIAVLLSACGSSASKKQAASSPPPASNPTPPASIADFFTAGAVTYTEAANANNASGFDPQVSGVHRVELPPNTQLRAGANWSASFSTFLDTAYVSMYPAGGSSSAVGTYALGGQDILGMFNRDAAGTVVVDCYSAAGTLAVDSDGGQGQPVTGTFSVTSWGVSAGTCPAVPTAGAFRFTREPNFGNTGTQGDSFALTPNGGPTATYTENNTTLYDPVVSAYFSNSYPTTFTIDAGAGANLGAGSYAESVFVQLLALPSNFDTAGGTFTVGAGVRDVVIAYANAANVSCVANTAAGTAVVSPYTAVGTQFTVDLTVTAGGFGNSGFCTAPPATPWTAHIVVTRDADQP